MPFDIYPTSTRKMRCPASSNQGETIASIPLWGFTSAACVQSSRRDGSTTNLDGVCSWTDTLIDHIFNGRISLTKDMTKGVTSKVDSSDSCPCREEGEEAWVASEVAPSTPIPQRRQSHGRTISASWCCKVGRRRPVGLTFVTPVTRPRTHVRPELFGLKGRIAQPLARSKTFLNLSCRPKLGYHKITNHESQNHNITITNFVIEITK